MIMWSITGRRANPSSVYRVHVNAMISYVHNIPKYTRPRHARIVMYENIYAFAVCARSMRAQALYTVASDVFEKKKK